MTAAPGARPAGNLNAANGVTVARMVLVVPFGLLLLAGSDPDAAVGQGRTSGAAAWLAAVVFAVAAATDRLDGQLARARGLQTELGAFLDPVADKALVGTALVGLSLVGEVPWAVTVVVLVREVGVTLLRTAVLRHGVLPVSRGGKAKTALQSLALVLLVAPLSGLLQVVALVVLAAAVLVTVVTGADYVVRALALRRAGAQGGPVR